MTDDGAERDPPHDAGLGDAETSRETVHSREQQGAERGTAGEGETPTSVDNEMNKDQPGSEGIVQSRSDNSSSNNSSSSNSGDKKDEKQGEDETDDDEEDGSSSSSQASSADSSPSSSRAPSPTRTKEEYLAHIRSFADAPMVPRMLFGLPSSMKKKAAKREGLVARMDELPIQTISALPTIPNVHTRKKRPHIPTSVLDKLDHFRNHKLNPLLKYEPPDLAKETARIDSQYAARSLSPSPPPTSQDGMLAPHSPPPPPPPPTASSISPLLKSSAPSVMSRASPLPSTSVSSTKGQPTSASPHKGPTLSQKRSLGPTGISPPHPKANGSSLSPAIPPPAIPSSASFGEPVRKKAHTTTAKSPSPNQVPYNEIGRTLKHKADHLKEHNPIKKACLYLQSSLAFVRHAYTTSEKPAVLVRLLRETISYIQSTSITKALVSANMTSLSQVRETILIVAMLRSADVTLKSLRQETKSLRRTMAKLKALSASQARPSHASRASSPATESSGDLISAKSNTATSARSNGNGNGIGIGSALQGTSPGTTRGHGRSPSPGQSAVQTQSIIGEIKLEKKEADVAALMLDCSLRRLEAHDKWAMLTVPLKMDKSQREQTIPALYDLLMQYTTPEQALAEPAALLKALEAIIRDVQATSTATKPPAEPATHGNAEKTTAPTQRDKVATALPVKSRQERASAGMVLPPPLTASNLRTGGDAKTRAAKRRKAPTRQ